MKTLLVTLHHRRSLFYEEGIKKFIDANYPLFIYNTGCNDGFGKFGLKSHLVTQQSSQNTISFDQGMMDLRSILVNKDWDTIFYIDNDIFFENIEYAMLLIKQFNESDYMFCSYFENGYIYKHEYIFDDLIAHVKNQTFDIVNQPPYHFKPNPHWENAFMLIKRDLWNHLTKTNFINSREMIKAIFESGAKMGVHKRESKLTYSHYGKGWFHIGNLMKYYYVLENRDLNVLSKDSIIDMSRIGYFLAQRKKFGNEIYTEHINKNLNLAIEKLGGENIVYQAYMNMVSQGD